MSLKASLIDAALGARFEPWQGTVRPYIGAGLVYAYAEYKAEYYGQTDDDSANSTGMYAHIGATFVPVRHFNFGVDYRIVRDTSIKLLGTTGDLNSDQFSIVTGFSW